MAMYVFFFFFSSRRRHTRYWRDWSSDVCSSDLLERAAGVLVELDDLGHGALPIRWSTGWDDDRPGTRSVRVAGADARRWNGPAAGAHGARSVPWGAAGPFSYFSTTASRSRAESTRYSSPAYLTSVPPYLE